MVAVTSLAGIRFILATDRCLKVNFFIVASRIAMLYLLVCFC